MSDLYETDFVVWTDRQASLLDQIERGATRATSSCRRCGKGWMPETCSLGLWTGFLRLWMASRRCGGRSRALPMPIWTRC
jgi:hypothetical protein